MSKKQVSKNKENGKKQGEKNAKKKGNYQVKETKKTEKITITQCTTKKVVFLI